MAWMPGCRYVSSGNNRGHACKAHADERHHYSFAVVGVAAIISASCLALHTCCGAHVVYKGPGDPTTHAESLSEIHRPKAGCQDASKQARLCHNLHEDAHELTEEKSSGPIVCTLLTLKHLPPRSVRRACSETAEKQVIDSKYCDPFSIRESPFPPVVLFCQ